MTHVTDSNVTDSICAYNPLCAALLIHICIGHVTHENDAYYVTHMTAVCCSVLQCVAVCCRVLQCVAVCCSVLQCVAVSGGVIKT